MLQNEYELTVILRNHVKYRAIIYFFQRQAIGNYNGSKQHTVTLCALWYGIFKNWYRSTTRSL